MEPDISIYFSPCLCKILTRTLVSAYCHWLQCFRGRTQNEGCYRTHPCVGKMNCQTMVPGPSSSLTQDNVLPYPPTQLKFQTASHPSLLPAAVYLVIPDESSWLLKKNLISELNSLWIIDWISKWNRKMPAIRLIDFSLCSRDNRVYWIWWCYP